MIPPSISVLIIGLGNIGTKLAEKCKQMGWTVFGVKRDASVSLPNVDRIYTLEDMFQILSSCDYVVNLLPENQNTVGVYNNDFFRAMKKTAIFCNVGRETAVVDKDISDAVVQHIIRGAVLDVHTDFDYKTDRIILTEHISYKTSENDEMLNAFYANQLHKFIKGERLNSIIKL